MLCVRSLARSLTFLAAFSLSHSLSLAQRLTVSSLSYSHLPSPQSLPFLVRTALVRLRYRCYLCCCCCYCRCFLVAVSNGGTGRQACEAGWADIQAVVRLRWHRCVLFVSFRSPLLFPVFYCYQASCEHCPLLLGLLVLWIQCVLCFLLYLFGILFNWK